jgi:hypothetical protein
VPKRERTYSGNDKKVAYAQVVELYPQEWLVADDPAWPTFAQYHEAYAQGLARAASEVGG